MYTYDVYIHPHLALLDPASLPDAMPEEVEAGRHIDTQQIHNTQARTQHTPSVASQCVFRVKGGVSPRTTYTTHRHARDILFRSASTVCFSCAMMVCWPCARPI